jgi:hypothetical protein
LGTFKDFDPEGDDDGFFQVADFGPLKVGNRVSASGARDLMNRDDDARRSRCREWFFGIEDPFDRSESFMRRRWGAIFHRCTRRSLPLLLIDGDRGAGDSIALL